jgi:outer membrane protein assembly factor BamB
MAMAAVATLAAAAAAQDAWTHRGYTNARNACVASGTAPSITTPRFVTTDSRTLVGQSMPAVADERIFVYARNTAGTGHEVLAFSEVDGRLLWSQTVGTAVQDSWSSPTVDTARSQVLMPSGYKVTALRADTGAIVWETTLNASLPIVNSSVCVVGDRAYITTQAPYSAAGKVYVLNLNPAHPTLAAGAIITSVALTKSLGNEVAYDATLDRLLVTDYGGYVRRWTTACAQDWAFIVPTPSGTYGAPAAGSAIDGDSVYFATYNYYGNGRLFRVNKSTNTQVWMATAERTDSVPVVTDSLVILSSGVTGFGSTPKIQAFNKTTGTKVWEWTSAGYWTVFPIVVGHTLFVGAKSSGGFYEACTDLYALDLTKTPSDAGFVVGHYVGAGSSPAYANGNIYTIGAAGLYAFGPQVGQAPAAVASWESVATGGDVALALTAGAVEPRLAGLRTLRLTFSEAIDPATVGSASLVITGQTGGAISTAGATATLSAGNTVLTFTLSVALPDADRYTVTLGSALRTASGRTVSQNGSLPVAALAGDVDGSGMVAASDVTAARELTGRSATVAPRADVNGSGTVTGGDLLAVRARLGSALP